jgi:hypothetical protein
MRTVSKKQQALPANIAGARVTRTLRPLIIDMIALHRTNREVIRVLEEEYGVIYSEHTLNRGYRWNPKYKALIEKRRETFRKNKGASPLWDPNFTLDLIHEAMMMTLADRRYKDFCKLVEQALKITGHGCHHS